MNKLPFPWRNVRTETPDCGELVIAKIKHYEGWHYCMDTIRECDCWLNCGDDEEVIEWFYLYEMPFDMFLTRKIELYDKTVYKNIYDARVDGATSEISVEGLTNETMKLIINTVSEVFGKDKNSIGIHIETE